MMKTVKVINFNNNLHFVVAAVVVMKTNESHTGQDLAKSNPRWLSEARSGLSSADSRVT